MMHTEATTDCRGVSRLARRGRVSARQYGRLVQTLGGVVAALMLATPSVAQPLRLTWSTFLRTGPGSGYAVVDEIQHDTLIDVRQCGAHWCQILSGRTLGYVDRDAITLPRLPAGSAPVGGPQGCFVAGQYAWRTPANTRFCETKPKN
jgi:hypothetical protein